MINKNLISNGDKILCGVSGGADSIAMVFALKQLENELDIKVLACHLNHKTRGEESKSDLKFTQGFCKKHSIPFYFEEIDITLDKSQGFEASARNIRYDFFNRALIFFKANKIATAHNCDDNLETLLLNISRGTGLRGLCGIPLERENIIRPILHKTRAEIEDFLKKHNISFIIDSSNLSDDYSRNKIRHHILPILNEINTKSTQNAYIMSKNLVLDEDFLLKHTQIQYEQIVNFDFCKYSIKIENLLNIEPALCYRVLNKLLNNFEITLSFANYDKIISICAKKNPSFYLDLYKDIEIFREYDTIVFRAKNDICEILNFKVNSNEIIVTTNKFNNLFNKFTIDYDKIDFDTLKVTHKIEKDKIQLKSGSKSLKKLFIDKKIPQRLREYIPVLRDKNGIICVCFIGSDIKRQSTNQKNIIFRSN